MADIKIPKQLFLELCKYFLYDMESADEDYIKIQLTEKLNRAAEHDRYTAALFAKK